jgi:hypothetical protein
VLITNAPRIDSRHIAAARPYQVGVVLNKDLSIVKTPVALVTRGLLGGGRGRDGAHYKPCMVK